MHYPSIIAQSKLPVVVLEIGCGRAEDTGRMVDWIIRTGNPYSFYVFEPEAKNIPVIVSKVGSRVNVVAAAVGDRNGRVPFIGSGSWPLSGSVKQPKEHLKSYPWIPWQPPVDVDMIRLDDFAVVHALPHVDFIWCDVQGAEDLVIAGGQETLKRTRYLYTETYESEEYAGQIGLAEIHRRLPGQWEQVQFWQGDIPGGGNVLFKNLYLQ